MTELWFRFRDIHPADKRPRNLLTLGIVRLSCHDSEVCLCSDCSPHTTMSMPHFPGLSSSQSVLVCMYLRLGGFMALASMETRARRKGYKYGATPNALSTVTSGKCRPVGCDTLWLDQARFQGCDDSTDHDRSSHYNLHVVFLLQKISPTTTNVIWTIKGDGMPVYENYSTCSIYLSQWNSLVLSFYLCLLAQC